MIMMGFLRLAGFDMKLSIKKTLPIHVSEVLYLSEDKDNMDQDEIDIEIGIFNKAEELFAKLEISNTPKNDFTTAPRVQSEEKNSAVKPENVSIVESDGEIFLNRSISENKKAKLHEKK